MAKCNFDIDFSEPIDELIEKAKDGITTIGGSFQGDTERGNYSIPTRAGKITGNYSVKDHSITFEITDKPTLVSCKKIEGELRKYLSLEADGPLNFD